MKKIMIIAGLVGTLTACESLSSRKPLDAAVYAKAVAESDRMNAAIDEAIANAQAAEKTATDAAADAERALAATEEAATAADAAVGADRVAAAKAVCVHVNEARAASTRATRAADSVRRDIATVEGFKSDVSEDIHNLPAAKEAFTDADYSKCVKVVRANYDHVQAAAMETANSESVVLEKQHAAATASLAAGNLGYRYDLIVRQAEKEEMAADIATKATQPVEVAAARARIAAAYAAGKIPGKTDLDILGIATLAEAKAAEQSKVLGDKLGVTPATLFDPGINPLFPTRWKVTADTDDQFMAVDNPLAVGHILVIKKTDLDNRDDAVLASCAFDNAIRKTGAHDDGSAVYFFKHGASESVIEAKMLTVGGQHYLVQYETTDIKSMKTETARWRESFKSVKVAEEEKTAPDATTLAPTVDEKSNVK